MVVLIADLTSLRNRVFFSYVPAMPSLMYVSSLAPLHSFMGMGPRQRGAELMAVATRGWRASWLNQ